MRDLCRAIPVCLIGAPCRIEPFAKTSFAKTSFAKTSFDTTSADEPSVCKAQVIEPGMKQRIVSPR